MIPRRIAALWRAGAEIGVEPGAGIGIPLKLKNLFEADEVGGSGADAAFDQVFPRSDFEGNGGWIGRESEAFGEGFREVEFPLGGALRGLEELAGVRLDGGGGEGAQLETDDGEGSGFDGVEIVGRRGVDVADGVLSLVGREGETPLDGHGAKVRIGLRGKEAFAPKG